MSACVCTGDIYIYVSICLSVDLFFAFGCWTLAIADSLSSQFRKHLDAPRKAEDAQVSDVYSFLGSKRLVDPVPQQHCHAMPCCAMLCCRPLPSHVLQIWGLRSCRAIMQFFVALGATRKQIARYSR